MRNRTQNILMQCRQSTITFHVENDTNDPSTLVESEDEECSFLKFSRPDEYKGHLDSNRWLVEERKQFFRSPDTQDALNNLRQGKYRSFIQKNFWINEHPPTAEDQMDAYEKLEWGFLACLYYLILGDFARTECVLRILRYESADTYLAPLFFCLESQWYLEKSVVIAVETRNCSNKKESFRTQSNRSARNAINACPESNSAWVMFIRSSLFPVTSSNKSPTQVHGQIEGISTQIHNLASSLPPKVKSTIYPYLLGYLNAGVDSYLMNLHQGDSAPQVPMSALCIELSTDLEDASICSGKIAWYDRKPTDIQKLSVCSCF